MGEPLRKLEIDGGDFERNNENTFNLNDLLHLCAVACGLSLLLLFASFWQGDDSGGWA